MDEFASKCGKCGASVYRQHIDSGIARYEDGKLLCSFCVSEFERLHDAAAGAAGQENFVPISFEDDEDEPPKEALNKSKIHVTAPLQGGTAARTEGPLTRAPDPASPAATRCRTFHAKLNEPSLDFMSNTINHWVDGDSNVRIKFATSTIGIFEGKHAEPHLIVTVFY